MQESKRFFFEKKKQKTSAKQGRGGFHRYGFVCSLVLAGCSQMNGGPQTAASAMPQTSVMNVADAAIQGGDPSMALKVSQSALATNPRDLDALYHEGAAYYAMNRCMDAMAVYKVALGIDAQSAEAQVGIGRCLLKRNAQLAEQAFTAAVQDDPNNADALNDLGVARDLQGNHAGAVDPYQKALLLKPGELSTEVNIGMSLALSGDGDDALQYLGPLATSGEATPKIRQDYAAALVAAGRESEARAVLAVDLPPDGVNQLLADFSAAIAAGTPAATAANTVPAEPAIMPAAPALVQAVPLAEAAPAPAIAIPPAAAPAVAQVAALPPQSLAPPAVVTPTAEAALPPSSLPGASLAVAVPPGASTATADTGTAASDKVVR